MATCRYIVLNWESLAKEDLLLLLLSGNCRAVWNSLKLCDSLAMICTYPVTTAIKESCRRGRHSVSAAIRAQTDASTLPEPSSIHAACQNVDGSFEKWNRRPPYAWHLSVAGNPGVATCLAGRPPGGAVVMTSSPALSW